MNHDTRPLQLLASSASYDEVRDAVYFALQPCSLMILLSVTALLLSNTLT